MSILIGESRRMMPGNDTEETHLGAIHAWLEEVGNGGTHRVLGIVGPPGVGKTALVEQVCAADSTQSRKQVAAIFFFNHNDPHISSVRACILSIAEQLGLGVPGNIQDTKQLFLGLDCTNLEDQPTKLDGRVVILDALDEADDTEALKGIVLELWEKKMPTWLSLLFTCRPMFELQWVKIQVYKMSYHSTRNENAIRTFLRSKFLALGLEGRALDEAVRVVTEQSKGFFVYTREFMRLLDGKDTVSLLEVCRMLRLATQGEFCDEVYKRYFGRLLNKSFEGDRALYQQLLSVMTVSRFPLDQHVLLSILEIDRSVLQKANGLFVVDEQGRLGFPHESMRHFLLSKERAGSELYVPANQGHELMVESLVKNVASPLALRHLIFHLCAVEAWEEVSARILDFGWLRLLISDAGATEQVTSDLEQSLNNHSWDVDAHVTEVVRALRLSCDHSETSPAEWTLEWLAFQLHGRIDDQNNNPVLESCKAFTAGSHSFLPISTCLEPTRSPLKKILRGRAVESVTFVAIDGDEIFAASEDKSVKVWDRCSGACLREMKGHTGFVTCVSVYGDIVASASDDKTVRVWDRQTGACLQIMQGHSRKVTSVAIDGDVLVSSSQDASLRVWHWGLGACLQVLEQPRSAYSAAIFGEMVVSSGGHDCVVSVWNWRVGECAQILKGHTSPVHSVAIDGDVVVSGSDDSTVRVWDWREGSCTHVLEGHSCRVRSVALCGDVIVSGSWDSTVRVWNLQQSGACQQVLNAHERAIEAVALSGNLVVSLSRDKTIRVWDVTECIEPEALCASNVSCAAVALFSSGQTGMVAGSKQGVVEITQVETGQIKRIFEGPEVEVLYVGFAGDVIVCAFKDGAVRGWSCAGEQSQEFGIDVSGKGKCERALRWASSKITKDFWGHTAAVTCVSSDGRNALVSGSNDETVRLWDIRRGRCFRVFKERSVVIAVAIDEKCVASSSWKETVRVWDRKSGRCLHVFSCSNLVDALDFNKGHLFAGDRDGTLYTWNGSSWNKLRSGNGKCYVSSVTAVGDTVWYASSDKTIRAWSANSLKLVASFDRNVNSIEVRNINGVWYLAASVDGQQNAVLLQNAISNSTSPPHHDDGERPEKI